MRNNHRISGPKSSTSRGHMYDSPIPTPSATRKTVGPRMWTDGGASGSLRMGMGSRPPACHTRSLPAGAAVSAAGRPESGCLEVVTDGTSPLGSPGVDCPALLCLLVFSTLPPADPAGSLVGGRDPQVAGRAGRCGSGCDAV